MADKMFTNPVTGDTLRILKTGAETGGELLEVEVQYTPAHDKPPAHYHPYQEEHFTVVSGTIAVEVDGMQRIYNPGESFIVPPGTRHAMWNAGESITQMTWQTRPALNTQQFFETIWGLAQDEKLGANGSPTLLQGAVLMQAYANEFRLASPPRLAQQIVFGTLAPLGRLRGHKAYYHRAD